MRIRGGSEGIRGRIRGGCAPASPGAPRAARRPPPAPRTAAGGPRSGGPRSTRARLRPAPGRDEKGNIPVRDTRPVSPAKVARDFSAPIRTVPAGQHGRRAVHSDIQKAPRPTHTHTRHVHDARAEAVRKRGHERSVGGHAAAGEEGRGTTQDLQQRTGRQRSARGEQAESQSRRCEGRRRSAVQVSERETSKGRSPAPVQRGECGERSEAHGSVLQEAQASGESAPKPLVGTAGRGDLFPPCAPRAPGPGGWAHPVVEGPAEVFQVVIAEEVLRVGGEPKGGCDCDCDWG